MSLSLTSLSVFYHTLLLRFGDTAIRQAATLSLGEFRSAHTLMPLLSALQDEDPIVRLTAVQALGAQSDSRAVGSLILMTADRDEVVAWEAVRSLRYCGKVDFAQAFREVLSGKRPSSFFRYDSRAYHALSMILWDAKRHPAVRRSAAKLLNHWSAAFTTPPHFHAQVDSLLRGLVDPDPMVRRIAAGRLGRLQHPYAFEPLSHALWDEDSVEVRRTVIRALRNYAVTRPSYPYVPSCAFMDPDADVRRVAADCAGAFMDPTSWPWLSMLAQRDNDKDVRHAAVAALGNFPTSDGKRLLIQLASDPDKAVAKEAIRSLLRMGCKKLAYKISLRADPRRPVCSSYTL